MQPTRERRGTTERRCSQATGTASLRPIRALTSDEIVTPARPPRDPPLPRAARSQGPNRRPRRPTGPCPHGPMPPDPCRCHRARTVTVRDQPNSPHCAPKSAPMGVPTSIVIVRGPQSTHPPLTGRRYRRATTDRTYGQAHHEQPSPLGRSHDRPRAAKSTRWLAVRSCRAHHRRQAGLAERTPSRPRVPRRDLRKGTRSGNPSIVRPEPAMAAASASTSCCSKRRRGSARPPSRRRD